MSNILICDDEKDIVEALKIYLSDPDWVLFSASTGQEALDILAREEIHLVLLDIMMPKAMCRCCCLPPKARRRISSWA